MSAATLAALSARGGGGQSRVLTARALREAWRTPEALVPSLLIPLFFLLVNVGQVAEVFPSATTGFLEGQGYAAFQLPATLLLAGSFASAALYLVEEVEGGYFDKLRATPASRTSLVLGRLLAEGVKGVVLATVVLLLALPFGVRISSGPVGLLLLVGLSAAWAVAYSGLMVRVALATRSAAATNSAGLVFFPLLFLTPNFVPRDMLTGPMEIAATLNPVTYVMEALRALVLEELSWSAIAPGAIVVIALAALAIALNVRAVRNYD